MQATPPNWRRYCYPYYTVEYMQGRVKTATKKAIVQQIVEPHWDKLFPSQQEGIRSLLEEFER
jgi:phenylpyruvate tautomerase PptA (4-oxalocrotonate tautomerase family)